MRTLYHTTIQRRQVAMYVLECLGALVLGLFIAAAPVLDERDAERTTAIQREVIFAALDQAVDQLDTLGK